MRPTFAILSSPATGSRRTLAPVVAPDRTPVENAALASVNGFLDALVALPLETWLMIGRDLIADRNGLVVRQSARAKMDAAVAGGQLGIRAWSVRDAVDTAASLVSRCVSRWSPEERGAFAATHGAAEAAALALLVSANLGPATLKALWAPFASCINAASF